MTTYDSQAARYQRRVSACDHAPAHVSDAWGFVGPVARDENRAAHGGVRFADTCRCGAVRARNVNGWHEEIGPWGIDSDRLAEYAEADRKAAERERLWDLHDDREVAAERDGICVTVRLVRPETTASLPVPTGWPVVVSVTGRVGIPPTWTTRSVILRAAIAWRGTGELAEEVYSLAAEALGGES